MPEVDLLSALRAREAEPSEFIAVLLTHFGYSQGSGPERRFGAQNSPPSLIVRYDGDGGVAEVLPGEAFDASEVEVLRSKVEREAIASTGIAVGRSILFSVVPLRGWYRYRDRFQLSPVPPDAPTSPMTFMLHPLMLETAFPHSENPSVITDRQARAEREISLLLGIFVGMGLKARPRRSPAVWVMDRNDHAGPSILTHENYSWPGMRIREDAFSDVAELEPADTESLHDIMSRMGGLDLDSILAMPSELTHLLDRYFALSVQLQLRYLRAAYWYDHAMQISSISRSATYVALSRAVEALLPPAPKNPPRCETCKTDISGGPTKRFSQLVDRLTGGAISSTQRRRFYQLRSKLTHGNELLIDDEEASHGTPSWLSQQNELMAMSNVARVVLLNWLIQPPADQA